MSTFGGFGGGGAAAATNRPSMIAQTDFNVPRAGDDGISSLSWSPTSNILISGSWDNNVRCWDVQGGQQGQGVVATGKAQGTTKQWKPGGFAWRLMI